MDKYKIKLGEIKEGKHSCLFKIKDSFFKDFSQSEVRHTNILATILLEKKTHELSLCIQLRGQINGLLCDLCADEISITISTTTKILLQETTTKEESTDEIIYISPGQKDLSIKHLLFELIILSIPRKREHETNKSGKRECNKEMITLVEKYTKKEKKTSDPRWDTLKDLKIKP